MELANDILAGDIILQKTKLLCTAQSDDYAFETLRLTWSRRVKR